MVDILRDTSKWVAEQLRKVHGNTDAKLYSVVDVSLIESAVHWHDYKTADMAFAALAKRDAAAPTASAS